MSYVLCDLVSPQRNNIIASTTINQAINQLQIFCSFVLKGIITTVRWGTEKQSFFIWHYKRYEMLGFFRLPSPAMLVLFPKCYSAQKKIKCWRNDKENCALLLCYSLYLNTWNSVAPDCRENLPTNYAHAQPGSRGTVEQLVGCGFLCAAMAGF